MVSIVGASGRSPENGRPAGRPYRQGAQIRWQGQPAGLPDLGRLGEPPLPSATTKLKRNAVDGLFTRSSILRLSTIANLVNLTSCPPLTCPLLFNLRAFTSEKNKRIGSFGASAGARGQRRASRNHEALVFPWDEAGPGAFRLPLRNPFWFRRRKGRSRPVLSRIASPSPCPVQALLSKPRIKSEAGKVILQSWGASRYGLRSGVGAKRCQGLGVRTVRLEP